MLLKLCPVKSERRPIAWSQEHQDALYYYTLTLRNPSFRNPSDASVKGLSCALYQEQHEKLRILGLGRRTLINAETRYYNSKLEFLALKWAISDHFRDYLYYTNHFDVYTYYNPLTYVKTSCKHNATGQRWVNDFANFTFTIHCKPGMQNTVVDSLRR